MDPIESRSVRLLARSVSVLSLTEATRENVPSNCFRYSHPVWTGFPLAGRPEAVWKATYLQAVFDILIQFEPDSRSWEARGCMESHVPSSCLIFSSSLNRIPDDWEARGCMESHVPSSCFRYSHPVWTGFPPTVRPETVWKAMYLQTVFDILIQFEPDSRWLGGQRLYGKQRTFRLFLIFSSSLNRIPADWEARGCMESHVPSSCFRYSHPVWTGFPQLGGQRLYGKPRTFKLFSIFSSSLNRIPADWEARGCMESHVLQAVFDIFIQFEPDSRSWEAKGCMESHVPSNCSIFSSSLNRIPAGWEARGCMESHVPSSCFRYSHPVWTGFPPTVRPETVCKATYLQAVLNILIQFEPDSRRLWGQRLYGKPCTFKLISIFLSSLNRIPADWEARGCMESNVPSGCFRYSHPVWTGFPLTGRPEAGYDCRHIPPGSTATHLHKINSVLHFPRIFIFLIFWYN